jgi:CRP-like cAMP-binding protein
MDGDRAEASDPIIEILKKIPIFDGLTLPEIHKIFNICRLQQYGAEETIYRSGSPSADMFILLEGSLAVRTSAGVELSQITPVGLVGEMGILTDEPRSADVVTLDNVRGFLIYKDDLNDLFIHNSEICRKMLFNVIQILSRKLYNANVQMEKLKNSAPEVSKEVDDLLAGNIFLY